tara:strand:+ start:339 stop:728 length:390 start_codon:yes stop_codon:yes gene_type:complete
MKKLIFYYDGDCPLCIAEVLFLSKRDKNKLINFVDINSEEFNPKMTQITCKEALDSMHGHIQGEGNINGVRVFAEAYKRVGLNFLYWFFSREFLLPLNNFLYKLFAKYRHKISKFIGPIVLKLVKKYDS